MNIDYYLHGTPKGFDFVGSSPSEKDYFQQNFYNKIFNGEHDDGKKGYTELRIEGLKKNGIPSYYYTYFIGNGISRCQEPRRAYLAITIRLESYYNKPRNLLFLLDSFFNGYIKHVVLNENGTQYKVSDFTGVATDVMASLNENLQHLIEKTFNNEDLEKIIIPGQRTAVFKLNLSDASDSVVKKYLSQCGEVSISEVYPSFKTNEAIKNKELEIASINNNHSIAIKQLETSHQSILKAREDEIVSLKNQQSGSGKQVKELKKQIEEERAKTKKVNDKLSQIKGIVSGIDMAPPVYIPPQPPYPSTGQNPYNGDNIEERWYEKKWVIPASISIIIAVILVSLIFLYKSCAEPRKPKPSKAITEVPIPDDYDNFAPKIL